MHLIYASTATNAPSVGELTAILQHARRKNAKAGVTGMLLYTHGSFFQVLEGAPADVDATFARIAADPRHTQPVTIIRERIATRAFGEWSMGFLSMLDPEFATAMGLNDFFAAGSCMQQLPAGRVKRVLSAFQQGRWRARFDSAEAGEPAAGMREDRVLAR